MTETPDFPLPEMIDGGPTEYDEVAMTYLLAAEVLWKRERDDHLPLVAPSTHLACTGLELFLKARLLERGYDHNLLRNRERFGHNIHKIWMMTEFAAMRRHAQGLAEACVEAKQQPIPDPKVQSLDWTINHLEKLYGGETHYALRYPQGTTTTKVPYVQPLLWVLAELIGDPKWKVRPGK